MDVTAEDLRGLFLFESLDDAQRTWLAERCQVRAFDAGALLYREGEPAAAFWVLLDGRVRLARRAGGEEVSVNETDHRGAYCGAVRAYVDRAEPHYFDTATATVPSRFLRLPAEDFGTAVRTWFPLAIHLLDGLYHGVRNSEGAVRERDHLARLGRLSADLAHELNNPAAAAVRAAGQLRSRVAGSRGALGAVASGPVDPEAIADLVALQERAVARAAAPRPPRSPVEVADAEDEVADRLEALGVADAPDLAAVLAGAGLDGSVVDEVAAVLQGAPPDEPLRWLADTLETEGLLDEIEEATGRISAMVAAVREYTHLDAASHSDVDLARGLDATVVMLGHKLGGVRVVREYDPALPRVPAYAGELNQVWTNLIDNAADATGGTGTLVLRTRQDGGDAVVEVTDDGPGVPESVRDRLFEAFVTTKGPGSGSGLGLDTARRIVEGRHGGRLELETGPGGTTFRVRLPLAPRTGAAEAVGGG